MQVWCSSLYDWRVETLLGLKPRCRCNKNESRMKSDDTHYRAIWPPSCQSPDTAAPRRLTPASFEPQAAKLGHKQPQLYLYDTHRHICLHMYTYIWITLCRSTLPTFKTQGVGFTGISGPALNAPVPTARLRPKRPKSLWLHMYTYIYIYTHVSVCWIGP